MTCCGMNHRGKRAKVTEEACAKARDLYRETRDLGVVADAFGVDRETAWRHCRDLVAANKARQKAATQAKYRRILASADADEGQAALASRFNYSSVGTLYTTLHHLRRCQKAGEPMLFPARPRQKRDAPLRPSCEDVT